MNSAKRETDISTQPFSARSATMQPSLIRAVHDRKGAQSLNLGLGQPSLPVPQEILDEGIRRLRSGPMGYTSNAGMTELRAGIAAHYDFFDRKQAENVIVTCGAQEAIHDVIMASVDPGDEVIVSDPAFPSYAAIAKLLGAKVVTVPRRREDNFRLNSEDIAKAITEKTRLVVVNSPGNPTASVDCEDQLRALAALADKHNFNILSDEIYADLVDPNQPAVSIAQFSKRVFFISGLSKNCAMTGFRLGYVIADTPRIQAVLRCHHMAATCAPVLSQHMAQFVFENPQRWLREQWSVYAQRRAAAKAAMAKYLPQISYIEPEGAFYILADFSAYTDDSLQLALDILQDVDVITAPGSAFGQVARTWLRFSYADEAEVFAEGLRRIGQFIKDRDAQLATAKDK